MVMGTQVEFFVHTQGTTPRVVTAAPADTLRDALLRAGVGGPGDDGLLVFVGENEEALGEADGVEDGADTQAPVEIGLTIERLLLDRHRHIHLHKCRLVAVDLHFGDATKHRRFTPSTTVGVVTRWARRKLRLDPAAAAEYVLQICKTNERPRPHQHLGELVEGTCALCFDLVKEITPQGYGHEQA